MKIRELPKKEWPAQLFSILPLPEKLWVRGTLPTKETKLLTISGPRAHTRYGQEVCERLIAGLAGYPISIVHGLSLGIDICAHKAALAAGLHTLAIPASGLSDQVLFNQELVKEMLKKGGGLLSEYAPDKVASADYFSARKRLMSGISHAELILGTNQKFATLFTSNFMHEENPDLLGFGFGEEQVTEPIHILEALGITPHGPEYTVPIILTYT